MLTPSSKEFKPAFTAPGMYPDYTRDKKDPSKSDDPTKAVRGLCLLVQSATSKSWILRYTLDGRTREMGLGALADVSLADARILARRARSLKAQGIDPVEQKRAAKQAARAEQAKRITFADAAKQYIETHRAEWRGAEHAKQWTGTIERFANPIIGSLPVADIDRELVLRVLKQQVGPAALWDEKTETANRLRGRIETVLGWAKANGYRDGDNPAAWTSLKFDLSAPGKRTVEHHAAMDYRDLPAFMIELRQQQGVAARALEFTILTAARSGETFGARLSEIDLEAREWTVPANRIKAGREHRVPLCDRAMAILAEVKPLARDHADAIVFPGRGGGKLSNAAMLRVLHDMGRDFSTHGFRASFKSWATAETDFKTEAVELALAHTQPDKVEQAYQRGDMFERRRELALAWCAYCSPLMPPAPMLALAGPEVA